MIADIVVGLQHGDEAKGKVTHHLCKNNEYTHVLRFNGGGNAGHTIYHEGQKFITHYIPAGVFYGIKSIIGSGCVLNPGHFLAEMKELSEAGIDTSLVRIAKNCQIITDEHLGEDRKDVKIGTTKRGTGPAYRDKYSRLGLRAVDVPELKEYIIDLYEEFHSLADTTVLCEGAQGFELDIDWGDYPYVTSSHCTSASALLNGIPPDAVRHGWGVGKVYDTYVGKKKFQPDDEVFNMLREHGEEYGATTGRPRQCNWLNLDSLVKSARINGITHMVLNKIDVLDKVGTWILTHGSELKKFSCQDEMCNYIADNMHALDLDLRLLAFSGNKHNISMTP